MSIEYRNNKHNVTLHSQFEDEKVIVVTANHWKANYYEARNIARYFQLESHSGMPFSLCRTERH